jgi:hypothetical protein
MVDVVKSVPSRYITARKTPRPQVQSRLTFSRGLKYD